MKNFTSRSAATAEDAKNNFDWLKAASSINLVETAVYSEPTCNTIVVEKDGEPVLMNSFRLIICMEALAPKPGISPIDEARALKELFESIKRVCRASGVQEVVFQCIDPTLEKFILRHGFTKVIASTFRIKVSPEAQQ